MTATSPIRVGLFVIGFPRRSETFIVTKVLKLLEHGFDVHVFTLTDGGDWDSFDVLARRDDVRARVHRAPALGPPSRVVLEGVPRVVSTLVRHPIGASRLAEHAWRHRREQPAGWVKAIYEHLMFVGQTLDVLHIEFDYQALGIADLKDYLGCRLLVSARGTLQKASTFTPASRDYLFRYVDGYHVISRSLELNLDRLGLPAGVPRWHIEPAIDLTLFQPRHDARPADGTLRIVSVGRLTWEKGFEFAIDALARLRDRGVAFHYTIYGDGRLEQAIRYAIHHHRLQDHVTLAGPRRREEIPGLLAAADVMLHAALDEGFCNAVIEAQAMELPVIASDAGGLPENVEDGVTGFIVPRRDPAAVADKLAVLAADPELRVRLGKAGRRRALARFDLDRQAEAFVALYRELVRTVPVKRVRSGRSA